MTREEAISIYAKHTGPFVKRTLPSDVQRECAEYGIDLFVALGILTLEEPKSAEDKLWEVLSGECGGNSWIGLTRGGLSRVLNDANLKLVEK